MGTEEYLLDKAMREGIERGRLEGIEKGIKKGRVEEKEQIAKNLILQLGLTDQQAAGVAEVSVSFVRKLRRRLKQNDPASI